MMIDRQHYKHFNPEALAKFAATGLPQGFKSANTPAGVEIQIYDIIGTEDCNEVSFSDALANAGGADVTIRLNSPGGSVFSGWAMFNALKEYAGQSTVIVDGVAASSASIVALGADKVLTQETSLWMVHNGWTITAGNADELRASAEILDKIDDNMKRIYAAKTNTDPETWVAIMANETWFSSSEAVKIGLADGIYEAPKPAALTTAQSLLSDQPGDVAKAVADDIAAAAEIAREVRLRRARAALEANKNAG
jgi:ATP-dependent protease ClpP protease subunit